MRWTGFVAVAGILISCALVAEAASPLSNSLTGFTGNSTQAGTQTAIGAAGLNFFSTTGEIIGDNGTPDDPSDDMVVSNHTVAFDSAGARFGSLIAGDGGRNYVRTNQSDYATVPFVAEITFTAEDPQAVFFGLGAGDTALFGTPDWSTQFSSASFWPEINNDKFVQFRTQNDVNAFVDTNVPGLAGGTHRFRMTFDPATRFLVGSIDTNYAGGPFVADVTGFPIVTSTLFAADGWPTEPSRIFFGGDDGATFRDLMIRVIPEPASWALIALGMAGLVAAGRSRTS
jgi:hypothetical protein